MDTTDEHFPLSALFFIFRTFINILVNFLLIISVSVIHILRDYFNEGQLIAASTRPPNGRGRFVGNFVIFTIFD